MDDKTKSPSCIPLVSRVDRLDSTMKYLEGKQNSMEGRGEKQCIPLNLAVREAQFKGSLLDRITWLEQRLHKITVEMESRNMVQTSRRPTYGETSSSGHGSCSLPVFTTRSNNGNGHMQPSQIHLNTCDHQAKSDRNQRRLKQPTITIKQQVEKKNRSNKKEKTTKSEKKDMPPNWPHFKILGC